MKKISLLTLILTSAVFAGEGDADALAGLVLGFISLIFMYIGGVYILAFIIAVIGAIGEAIAKLWEKCNSFGRIILFGIPLFGVTTTAFYFLIWYALVPGFSFYIIHCNLDQYRIWFQIPIIGSLYICLFFLGWTSKNRDWTKRKGIICWIARMIALSPVAPIILICKLLFESFATAFITEHKFSMNLQLFAIEHDMMPKGAFKKVKNPVDFNAIDRLGSSELDKAIQTLVSAGFEVKDA